MNTPKLKKTRILNEFFTLILVLLIVILGYFLVVQFLNFRWDLTTTGEFSFSNLTRKTLQEIKKSDRTITVTVFYRPNSNPEERLKRLKVLDLLDEYHLQSGKKIKSANILNPDQHPDLVKKLGVRQDGTIVFQIGEEKDERHLIQPRKIWGVRFENGRPNVKDFRGEIALTSGLIKLINKKDKVIYFTTGHQEPPLRGEDPKGHNEFVTSLEQNNFFVRPLILVPNVDIPKDAEAVVLAGPLKKLLPHEDLLLGKYFSRGGRILLLIEYNTDLGLNTLIPLLGVEIGNNLILDPLRGLEGNLTAPIPFYGNHIVVKDLSEAKLFMLLQSVRSIERALGDTRKIILTELLNSSSKSWAESNFQSFGEKSKKIVYNEGSKDLKGPVTMAMAIARPAINQNDPISQESRAIVVGDADFSKNEFILFGANKDFLLNSLNWLVGKEKDIGIQPKDPVFHFITITNWHIWVTFAIVVFIIPGLVFGFGVIQWWQRRSL